MQVLSPAACDALAIFEDLCHNPTTQVPMFACSLAQLAPTVRNLLMVPSRRRAQVLKATKLAEVNEIRDEEEKPQCNGRREGGQGDDLKGSNDG